MLAVLSWIAFALAALPAAVAAMNLPVFRRLPGVPASAPRRGVSLLIPARNEEANIAGALDAALASRRVDLELIVMDDGSTDRTAAVVRDYSARDRRVRLEPAPPLPEGWCGKQHACWRLAHLARHELLVWIDADVRLAPAALARIAGELDRRPLGLLSGFPRQVTGTWLEKLVVPMIELLLLGYFPVVLSRRWCSMPGLATGCGQLMAARRDAYFRCGGHAAVRRSLHEGITLPPMFRKAGEATDIFDASDVARCRMYRGAGEVWRGFSKNACEGLGSPRGIVVWTLLLVGGFVLPWVVLVGWLTGVAPGAGAWAVGAAALSGATSMAVGVRARHPWLAVLARPAGVVILLAIQWQALGRHFFGCAPVWRGRSYAIAPGPSGPPGEHAARVGAEPSTQMRAAREGMEEQR